MIVVDALATYRLTRLVTTDLITSPIRERVIREAYAYSGSDVAREQLGTRPIGEQWAEQARELDDDPPKLATLITCTWCASVWVAFGVVAVRAVAPRLWDPVARVLALSALAGLASSLPV